LIVAASSNTRLSFLILLTFFFYEGDWVEGITNALVTAPAPSAVAPAERRYSRLDVYGGSIVQRLCAQAGLARSKYAHEYLCETVRDARGPICTCLGSRVEGHVAQLVLPAAIRAKSAIV
jgi:hypothetical protein